MALLMLLPVVTGLLVALATFRAGLPKFALAIAASLVLGFALACAGWELPGLVLFAVAIGLVLASKRIMSSYKVGPYSTEQGDEN